MQLISSSGMAWNIKYYGIMVLLLYRCDLESVKSHFWLCTEMLNLIRNLLISLFDFIIVTSKKAFCIEPQLET